MVYIIILNWKGAADTLACLDSLALLRGVDYRLVICDNASPDHSYDDIRAGLLSSTYYAALSLIELDRTDSEHYVISATEQNAIYLIQTCANLGYAGGNNVGIRFALNQKDMEYVWVLNNDTIVEPDALALMVDKCNQDPEIGICGCRLVYEHDRTRLQGLGGCYNSWLGTTWHFAANMPANSQFNDEVVSSKIDYVIGASILLSRSLLERVGLFSEDYFLYFEELDLSYRARKLGIKQSVISSAVVYHKEGSSTGDAFMEKSNFADMLSIRNRLLFTRKFQMAKLPFVWFGLWLVLLNRLRRLQFYKAKQVFKIILTGSC